MVILQKFVRGLLLLAAFAAAMAQAPVAREIALSVDLTDAPRKLIHATETMAVSPGQLTLVYPEWIPGEHGPTGPIDDMAGLAIAARAANEQACMPGSDRRVKWERDKVDMYSFHLTVPEGCTELEIKLDFLATAAPVGFSAGASTSENLAVLSWNEVVLYREGANPADLRVAPSITLPSAWQFGTALHRRETPSVDAPTYSVSFEPVSLETLLDSPVLAGKYFKEVALAPEIAPKHFLDLAADGPEDLNLPPERVENFSRLVRETGALYQSRHYGEYHFLVTLSDSVAHFGRAGRADGPGRAGSLPRSRLCRGSESGRPRPPGGARRRGRAPRRARQSGRGPRWGPSWWKERGKAWTCHRRWDPAGQRFRPCALRK